jgi:aldehyde dehydrogenase (NAD+)
LCDNNAILGTKGNVVAGGLDKCNRKTLMFAPTVVTGVKPGDALLAEEIFGKHFAT